MARNSEVVIDAKTGHEMEVGALTHDADPLWGFHCVTCNRFFARRLSGIQVDQIDAIMTRFLEEHSRAADKT